MISDEDSESDLEECVNNFGVEKSVNADGIEETSNDEGVDESINEDGNAESWNDGGVEESTSGDRVAQSKNDDGIEEPIDIESVEDVGTNPDTTRTVPPLQCAAEEKEEDSGEWFFETDYVVLKNNLTYQELIKTVVTLQAQRVQMVKDLDTVLEVKENALRDPMAFVRKIERHENLGIPPRINIAKIPEIDWSQYNIGLQGLDGPATRGCAQKATPATDNDQEEEEKPLRVRGRAFNEGKPETFNQLWTSEEQQRLEELLVEYPPEERESRRWSKIAAALGNRTKNQVTSRVQKYFIKLQRAGLPVPGRVPRSVGGGHRHAHQRYNHHLFRPTTFFPNHPCMSDNADEEDREQEASSPDAGDSEWSSNPESDSEDDTMQISEKVAEATNLRTIRLLQRVLEDKEKEVPGARVVIHSDHKCDVCQEEPLMGTRWHCAQCSVDFCSDCLVLQLDSEEPHPPSHHIESFRKSKDSSRYYRFDTPSP